MPVDPREILGEIAPDSVPADAPPAVANYRHADLQGVSCAFCQKFTMTGLRESDGVAIPVGVCDQWEANVDGVKVCDRFASGAPAFDHNGEEVWDFADGERTFNEIHLAGTESVEDSGFVVKEVLRTGEWPVIPTASGVIGKPLRVVRDGVSSAREGVISMSELVANFEAGAIERPQIPLSDDRDDHKNITRVNTGFVRGLWIEDKDSGAVLKAKMEFTEPEVKAKVLRGTYADVSCGIPWKIRARGKEYGATLEHIAITNRPFIDGLGPFLAASDEQRADAEIVNYGDHIEVALSQGTVEIPPLSDEQIVLAATSALEAMAHNYARDYAVTAADGVLRLRHDRVGTTWTVPFQASEKDGEISLAFSNFQEWTVEEGETIEPSAQGGSLPAPELSDLEKAWRLRELRLAQPLNAQRAKESYMPLSREELAALELSDDAEPRSRPSSMRTHG